MNEGREYYIAVVSESLKNSEEIAQWFEDEIGVESRITVLGHIQRGGNPTVYDRLMAFNFITHAIDGLLEGKKCSVVCYSKGGFNHKKIDDVAFKEYHINENMLKLGSEFGQNR